MDETDAVAQKGIRAVCDQAVKTDGCVVSVSQSPPKLGGDALAKRGLGRSVQNPAKRLLMDFRVAHRINKERCAVIDKVASRL